jgi:hypothetical protein
MKTGHRFALAGLSLPVFYLLLIPAAAPSRGSALDPPYFNKRLHENTESSAFLPSFSPN